ncbi:hypothetical protein M885DRAFT_308711 [Pelagophyceae sp. CCMP2097]|nr:hypothetical protein M885DRAFT_308711 [Pelagophyceae sp. CCMP2097]
MQLSKSEKATLEDGALLEFKHRCLDHYAGAIRKCFDEGGFTAILPGVGVWKFIPCFCFVVQDTPEANNLALVYNYWLCQRPYRICTIKLDDVGTAREPGPQRNADATRELVEDAALIIRAHIKGARDEPYKEAQLKLKEASVYPILNAFWKAPFGANPAGIHGALGVEWLHCGQLGVEAHLHAALMEAVDSIKELPVDGHNEPYARFFKNELATKLDGRVKVMAPQLQHQCDRGIPVKPLESGVTDLTKLHGQEMPALLLMLIVSVGDEGAILPVAMSRPFAALIWALLCLDAYVMAAAWDSGMRGRFKDVVRYVMDGFTALVGPRRTSASDDTGLKFPKYHQLVHLFDQEAEWGPLILGYGGFWESAMKFFVKKTTLRTQRRAGTLVAQVMKRLGLIE